MDGKDLSDAIDMMFKVVIGVALFVGVVVGALIVFGIRWISNHGF